MADEETCLICGGTLLLEDETDLYQGGFVHKRCLQKKPGNEHETEVLDEDEQT